MGGLGSFSIVLAENTSKHSLGLLFCVTFSTGEFQVFFLGIWVSISRATTGKSARHSVIRLVTLESFFRDVCQSCDIGSVTLSLSVACGPRE